MSSDPVEPVDKPKLELPASCDPPPSGVSNHQLVWIVSSPEQDSAIIARMNY